MWPFATATAVHLRKCGSIAGNYNTKLEHNECFLGCVRVACWAAGIDVDSHNVESREGSESGSGVQSRISLAATMWPLANWKMQMCRSVARTHRDECAVDQYMDAEHAQRANHGDAIAMIKGLKI